MSTNDDAIDRDEEDAADTTGAAEGPLKATAEAVDRLAGDVRPALVRAPARRAVVRAQARQALARWWKRHAPAYVNCEDGQAVRKAFFRLMQKLLDSR